MTETRTWQVAAHLSGLVGLAGIPSVVGPLVVWLIRRQDPDIEPHARAALNFHLSILIYAGIGLVIGAVLVLSLVGIFLLPLLALGYLLLVAGAGIFSVVGAVRASDGILYRYPLALRLVSEPQI